MFLYELAVELGLRSGDLIDAAAELGLGALATSTVLDAHQVATLRHELSPPGSVPPPPPAAAPLPPPPPPPSASAPPPPPMHPPMTDASDGFEPPVRFEPAPSPAMFASVGAASPPAFASASPDLAPPPPPPGSGSPRRGPMGFSRGQLAAIAAVVVLVVALFGFMVVNGRDTGREREIADDVAGGPERERPELPVTTTTTTTDGSASAQPAPSVTSPADVDRSSPADLTTFCTGGEVYLRLMTRIGAAVYDDDIAELKDLVANRRAEWDTALDQIERGGPPMYADEVASYRSGMATWFADVPGASSVVDSYASLGEVGFLRVLNAGDEFERQIPYYCK